MRPSRSSRDSDLVSSQTERRGEIFNDEFSLPGLVAGSRESNEDIFGASVSDDDDDAEPIPPFLLPGESLNKDGSRAVYRISLSFRGPQINR